MFVTRLFLMMLVTVLMLPISGLANERFFTLSGGTDGDSSDAMHEAQISEIRDHMDARANCAIRGKIYAENFVGETHPKADDNGCITSLDIEDSGHLVVDEGLSVTSGDVKIGSLTVKDHALMEPTMCEEAQKLVWNGSAWGCQSEVDPEVGTLESGKWCAADGDRIVCNKDAPTADSDGGVFDTTLDNKVRDFARKDKSALRSCAPGEVLTSDGVTLLCAGIEAIAEGTLALNDLSDVDIAFPAVQDLLFFDGTEWVNGSVVEHWTKEEIDQQVNNTCRNGDVLTYDGEKLVCIPDIGGENATLSLEELSDVSGTVEVTPTYVLKYDGAEWTAMQEDDPLTRHWAKVDIVNLTSDACGTDEVLTYDGVQLLCIPDVGGAGNAMTLSGLADVSLTAPVNEEIMEFNGSQWVNMPGVQDFARDNNPLPNCPGDHILTADGNALSCVSDAGSGANTLGLDDLNDVSITTPRTRDLLVYTGSGWENADDEIELWARTDVLDYRFGGVESACAIDEVLTLSDGGGSSPHLRCKAAFADNTTFVERDGFFVVDEEQTALPSGITGAGARALWYPYKSAFRAGEVTASHWDDGLIGQYSVALGHNTQASGNASFAVGSNAQATGAGSMALGSTALSTAAHSVAIGDTVQATGTSSMALGFNNTRVGGPGAIALGTTAQSDVSGSVAVGSRIGVTGENGLALGHDLAVTGENSFAIGRNMTVSGRHSLGVSLDDTHYDLTGDNIFGLMGARVGISTLAPNAALEVSGSIIVGDEGLDCTVLTEGTIRYANGTLDVCDGTSWKVTAASDVSGTFKSGAGNLAVGEEALSGITSGANNIAFGHRAGLNIEEGSRNIMIGHNVSATSASANDELNIGDTIYGNIANGYVGIGIPTPLEKMHIYDDVDGSVAFMIENPNTGTAARTRLKLKNAQGEALIGFNNGASDLTIQNSTEDTDIVFWTNNGGSNDDRVVITSTGRVGIGTNTPDYSLDVIGSIAATTPGVDGTFQDAFVAVYSTNNNESNAIQSSVSTNGVDSGFRFQSTVGGGSPSRETMLDLMRDETRFYTAGEEQARIDAQGRVGIATTTPQATLDVSGTLKVAGTGTEGCDSNTMGSIRYDSVTGPYANLPPLNI